MVLCLCLVFGLAACGDSAANNDDDAYHTGRYIPTEDDTTELILEDDVEHKFEAVDFDGPDGSRVLVVVNTSDKKQHATLHYEEGCTENVMKPHSIMTLIF